MNNVDRIMHETTVYCACGDPDCPLQMHVVWDSVVFVHVMDMHGKDDRQNFTHTEFIALLEELYTRPGHDDTDDIYTYDLETPLRYGIDTFHINGRNYDYLLQHTKDIISANAAL